MSKFRDLCAAASQHEFSVADDELQMRANRRERLRRTAAARASANSRAPKPAEQHSSPSRQTGEGVSNVPALTSHGKTRLRQRGITVDQVLTVLDFGKEQRSYGATRFFLDRQARARVAVEMPQALRSLPTLDIFVVLGDDGQLITAAHRNKRIRRH